MGSIITVLNNGRGVEETPAPPFAPSDLPNLEMWLKSDAGVTQSGTVSAWANQASTGSTYDLSQSTSGNRPTYNASALNSLPGISFDNSNDRMTIANALVFTGDFTITFVTSPEWNASQPTYLGHSSTGAYIRNNAFNQTTFCNNAGTTATINPHSPLDSQPHILTFTRSGSTITRRVDGIDDGSATLSGTISFDTLGLYSAGTLFRGSMFEITAHDSALSGANILLIEDYYRQRYNIAKRIIILASESTMQCNGTASVNSGTGIAGYLAAKLRAEGYGHYSIFNEAISGTTITNANTRAKSATGIDNKTYYTQPILFAWLAGNDIGAANSTIASRYQTYISDRVTAGKYAEIFGSTLYAAINTSSTNAVLSWNAYLLANPITGVTAVTDITSNAELNSDGDYNNTTYYQGDKQHLASAGNSIVVLNNFYPLIEPYLVGA